MADSDQEKSQSPAIAAPLSEAVGISSPEVAKVTQVHNSNAIANENISHREQEQIDRRSIPVGAKKADNSAEPGNAIDTAVQGKGNKAVAVAGFNNNVSITYYDNARHEGGKEAGGPRITFVGWERKSATYVNGDIGLETQLAYVDDLLNDWRFLVIRDSIAFFGRGRFRLRCIEARTFKSKAGDAVV